MTAKKFQQEDKDMYPFMTNFQSKKHRAYEADYLHFNMKKKSKIDYTCFMRIRFF
jgi:hypothetical protein